METTYNTPVSIETTVALAAKKAIQIGRFEGSFKLFGSRFFNDLKYYGINAKIAHKVANDGMASLGLAMSKDADLAAKISKANKNGEGKFKLSGSSALVATSNAMILIRLTQQLEALREEKLLSKPLKLNDLTEFLKKEVQEYLDECAAWVNSQEWEESAK